MKTNRFLWLFVTFGSNFNSYLFDLSEFDAGRDGQDEMLVGDVRRHLLHHVDHVYGLHTKHDRVGRFNQIRVVRREVYLVLLKQLSN